MDNNTSSRVGQIGQQLESINIFTWVLLRKQGCAENELKPKYDTRFNEPEYTFFLNEPYDLVERLTENNKI